MIGGILILAGVLVFGLQGLLWLREGYWSSLSFLSIFQNITGISLSFEWKGIEKIVIWVLDIPLGAAFIVMGLLLQSLGSSITDYIDRFEDRLAKYKMKKKRKELGYDE